MNAESAETGREVCMKEIVLYYAPENAVHVGLIKGVLVQMGIRIKNLISRYWQKAFGVYSAKRSVASEQIDIQWIKK